MDWRRNIRIHIVTANSSVLPPCDARPNTLSAPVSILRNRAS